MKRKIIIYSNFNTPNYMKSPYLEAASKKIKDDEWINGRMDIFFEYTLEGFIGQTNQDFTAVYDYTDSSENQVLKAIEDRGGLPNNILFVPRSKYAEVIDELSEGYEELYLAKLDSDDVYKKDFVDLLYNYKAEEDTEALICGYGYMYDTMIGKMAKMWHVSSSFHVYIYKLKIEQIKYDSLDLTPLELLDSSHFLAVKHKHEYIPGYNYLWIIHNNNSSTRFGNYNSDILKTIEIISPLDMLDVFDDFI